MPMIGMRTACATCQTMRTATGLTQGPERPPVMLPSTGRNLLMSISMPSSVLMSDTASAPAASTALAIATMSVTFGESLRMTGFFVCALASRTTAEAASGSVPKTMPPSLTFGHETLSSMAATPGTSRRPASLPYSSAVLPEMLTMTFMPYCWMRGSVSSRKCSTPGFSRPMQLSMPSDVSVMRTPSLPRRGRSVVPLTMTPPRRERSTKSLNSSPKPNVPEAVSTGVFMAMPRRFVWSRSSLMRTPPLPGRRGHPCRPSCAGRPSCQSSTRGRRRGRRPCASRARLRTGCRALWQSWRRRAS